MKKVVIVSAVRTPIGAFGGSLSGVKASELGGIVIKEAMIRAGLDMHHVDEVYMGCVLQAGLGQNVARQASLSAGLGVEVSATTINAVCGSGLKSVIIGANQIALGCADVIVAGGTENMSMAPYVLDKARNGYRMGNGTLIDTMINEGLTDAMGGYHMGITAENLAERYSISRVEQDEYAARSQQKCEDAIKRGAFCDEIVGVQVRQKKEKVMFDKDEYPRSSVTAESLAKLRPAFKSDGTVTAANASGINDGAACVILMSEEKAQELGIKPIATWVSGSMAGVEPEFMGIGPVNAVNKLLKETGKTVEDVDLFEANEAFAVQALAVCRELNLEESKVNVNGGAIALGHPIGASGCRILVTLIHEMRKKSAKRGIATLCIGGGMGVAAMIEM